MTPVIWIGVMWELFGASDRYSMRLWSAVLL